MISSVLPRVSVLTEYPLVRVTSEREGYWALSSSVICAYGSSRDL